MMTSKNWIEHFKRSADQKRVDWNIEPKITQAEISVILSSLQAWQLGETSEGKNLIMASTRYAKQIADPYYVDAVKLFIAEEQKHGNNLGMYLDRLGERRIKSDWGDSLFRRVRYFNTNMEIWTLAVIVVESTAQIFYQALKDATKCALLKQICTDILIDEAHHITFQTERMAIIFDGHTVMGKYFRKFIYRYFFYFTSTLVWVAHRKLFKAGGNTFLGYIKKMEYKYLKTLHRITDPMFLQTV